MAVFEVAIYNSEVVEALDKGQKHPDLDDDWVDTHFIEFNAPDEAAARARAEQRYPANRGYVITAVV